MSRITSKFQLTVPRAVAERAGYRAGDEVEFEATGEFIRVRHKAREQRSSATDRLVLFDLATERQVYRQRAIQKLASPADRGWTRDELYE